MQAIAPARASAPEIAGTDGDPGRMERWRVDILDSLDASAPVWRRLEKVSPCTPYQQFAWAEAWCATVGASRRQTPLIAVVHDERDRAVALLPFVRRSRAALQVAQFIGGKDSNGNLALFTEPAAWDGPALGALLAEIGRRSGLDVFALQNQPATWSGRPNPFASLPHQASPSGVATTALAGYRARQSKHARKRLRQKTNWLEALGLVELRRATTRDEVDAILAAHVAHRTARAATSGVEPPSPAQLSFYRAAADPLRTGGAPMQLMALWCGADIVATFGVTRFRDSCSGMILSVDSRPAFARCSPGELLLRRLVPTLESQGLARFDLGIGEARYKDGICEQGEPLFDCFVPVTAAGRLAAFGLAGVANLKRRVKQSGSAWDPARRLATVAGRTWRIALNRP